MATSRGTSNGPDWMDVTRVLLAFEEQLSCSITITLRAAGSQRDPQLLMLATAVATDAATLAPRYLASSSVSMPGAGVGDIAAALLSLGYELDKEVYRRSEGFPPKQQ